jgi:hypothetical protein
VRIQFNTRCKRLIVPLAILTSQTVGLGRGQTCNTLITDLQNWVTKDAKNRLHAYVSSHRWDGEVTYAKPTLRAVNYFGTLSKSIVTDVPGKQYFSSHTWSPPCTPGQTCLDQQYPFSPLDTKQLSLSISSTGAVTVKPNSGAYTHALSGLACFGPYMYGFHMDLTKTYPYGAMYVLTFIKFTETEVE